MSTKTKIDWEKENSELAKKGRFDQTWMIAKELKDEGEGVCFVSVQKQHHASIVWNNKFYEAQEDFMKLMDDYTEWSKAHYNR